MKLIDLLIRAGMAGSKLIAVLEYIIANVPDLADEARTLIEKLNAAVPLENLLSIAAVIPVEVGNVLAGKIDPREHPSDAA